jgi:hypothetical protein
MFKSLLISAMLMTVSLAHANETLDPSLVIDHVEVVQLKKPVAIRKVSLNEKTTVTLPSAPGGGGLGEVAMILDGLLAIGKKVWPIIDANRPVINTTGLAAAISVLPQFDQNAKNVELHQMANWSVPRAVSYRVSYKNLYGMEMVGFTYTVYFQYNGSLKGNGKYIAGLAVQASEVAAAWSTNFDATSELVQIANVGTSMDPVASATIRISYKVRGLLNEMRNAQTFYVDGRGQIKLLQ